MEQEEQKIEMAVGRFTVMPGVPIGQIERFLNEKVPDTHRVVSIMTVLQLVKPDTSSIQLLGKKQKQGGMIPFGYALLEKI